MPARDLDLKLLRYFLVVVEERSFTAAGLTLHLSQPALSQAIQRLEASVGARLIERDSRRGRESFALTPTGEVMVTEAVDLLAHADRTLQRVLRARASSKSQVLTVGFSTSTPRELTDLAVRVAKDLPDIELVLVHVPWGEERDRLTHGAVDLLFLQLASTSEFADLDLTYSGTSPRVGVFAAGHRLADRETLSIADLRDEPILDASSDRDFWIVSPRPDYPLPPVIGPAARTVEEMLASVSAQRGMAITSAAVAANHGSDSLAFIPITDLSPVEFAMAHLPEDQRPHVVEYVRLLRERVS